VGVAGTPPGAKIIGNDDVPEYNLPCESGLNEDSGALDAPEILLEYNPTGYKRVVVAPNGVARVPVNEIVIGEEDVYVLGIEGHDRKRLPIVVVAAGRPPVIGLEIVIGVSPGPFV